MWCLLLVVAVAAGKTVRYSNVPPRSAVTTKTYDLQVPGSPPIRIIEAEPIWSTEDTRNGLEHRSAMTSKSKQSFTTQPTKTTISEPVTQKPEETASYSPDALNQFLKKYAEKVKIDRKKFVEDGDEVDMDLDDNAKSNWDMDYKRPFDDKKGWVTLEAVPWSTSKISKWQSNNKKETKPWENNTNKPGTSWSYKPYKNHYYQSTDNQYNNDQYNANGDIFLDKPLAMYDVDIRPAAFNPAHFSRPSYEKPNYSNWPSEVPSKPSWNQVQSTQSSWNDRFSTNSNFGVYLQDDRDIITDGRPGDFPHSVSKPKPKPYYYDAVVEQPRPNFNNHPPTHPANGNGEWVLLSTTKGYQYPRTKHERSLEVTPDSIGTRRGIRLTVLPPDGEGSVNMTTSHGGLLEVESTFETVEDSHKLFSERLKNANRTRLPARKVVKRPVKSVDVSSVRVPEFKQIPILPNRQDATAVLAAVGAGMVPATMAMLVPFVAGRKRRSTPILRS